MRQHEFDRISSGLQSLADSTYLAIDVAGIHISMHGRCSPYKSHREIKFSASASPIRTWAILDNGKYKLAIGSTIEALLNTAEGLLHPILDPDGICDLVFAQIPADLVAPFRAWTKEAGIEGPLVGVVVPMRRVASWTPEGNPVFVEPRKEPEPKNSWPSRPWREEAIDRGLRLVIEASRGTIVADDFSRSVISGCEHHPLEWWEDLAERDPEYPSTHGEVITRGMMLAWRHGYSPAEIEEYVSHFAHIAAWMGGLK